MRMYSKYCTERLERDRVSVDSITKGKSTKATFI